MKGRLRPSRRVRFRTLDPPSILESDGDHQRWRGHNCPSETTRSDTDDTVFGTMGFSRRKGRRRISSVHCLGFHILLILGSPLRLVILCPILSLGCLFRESVGGSLDRGLHKTLHGTKRSLKVVLTRRSIPRILRHRTTYCIVRHKRKGGKDRVKDKRGSKIEVHFIIGSFSKQHTR